MVEASSGCRHTNLVPPTLKKYIDLGQIDDDAPFDDDSGLTQLEAYESKLKADLQDLRPELIEKTECNQVTVDKLEAARALEKTHTFQSLRRADLNTLRSSEPSKEAIDANLRKKNPSV